jgi:hypothetical protein
MRGGGEGLGGEAGLTWIWKYTATELQNARLAAASIASAAASIAAIAAAASPPWRRGGAPAGASGGGGGTEGAREAGGEVVSSRLWLDLCVCLA